MLKKRLLLIILAIALAASLAGCIQLQSYAGNANLSPSVSSQDLPTLAPESGADLIPLSVFTSYYEYEAPQVSADGSKILFRHTKGNGSDYMVEDWKTGAQSVVNFPDAVGIPYCNWAPDAHTVLFFIDNNGDENYGLYTSDIDTGDTKTILKSGDNLCYYVSDYKQNEKEIYIMLLNRDTKLFDLYLINYETGDKTLILKNPGYIQDYTFDREGYLRAVTMTDDKAGKHVWIKNDINNTNTAFSENEWKEFPISWGYEDAKTSGIYGIMPDGKGMLYIDSSETNTSALYQFDFAFGKSTEIFNDPDYDLINAWTDLSLDKVTAVPVYSQKIEWNILDPSFQDDYDALSKVGSNFDIVGSSDEDKVWIVDYISDTKESDYYAYDMATKQETFLFNAEPDLGKYKFAPTEPFSYTATDGLKVEGYATFPLGSDKKNLPTVMLVHGGPNARDFWEFNKDVQFLVSRGYLVLQVNYRGSTGYGKKFMHAGDKEWGGKMHQDILDAVNYAETQGWTDKDRVGVYGGSYGGYEALACAAFSSDVFKCSADMSGISDLTTFLQSIPDQWSLGYQSLVRSVGDPVKDAELLKQRSPLYHAEDVKIPVLIAAGTNDPRVTIDQSDRMVDALKAAGADVTYLRYDNTGHGLYAGSEMETFYTDMEKMFAKYLGGKTD